MSSGKKKLVTYNSLAGAMVKEAKKNYPQASTFPTVMLIPTFFLAGGRERDILEVYEKARVTKDDITDF